MSHISNINVDRYPYTGLYKLENGISTEIQEGKEVEVLDPQLRKQVKERINSFFNDSIQTRLNVYSSDEAVKALFQRSNINMFFYVFFPIHDALENQQKENSTTPMLFFTYKHTGVPGCGLCMSRFYVVTPCKERILFNQFVYDMRAAKSKYVGSRFFPLPAHYKRFDDSVTLSCVFHNLELLSNQHGIIWPSVIGLVHSEKSPTYHLGYSHYTELVPRFLGEASATQSISITFPADYLDQLQYIFDNLNEFYALKFTQEPDDSNPHLEIVPICLKMTLFDCQSKAHPVECWCKLNLGDGKIIPHGSIPQQFSHHQTQKLSFKNGRF